MPAKSRLSKKASMKKTAQPEISQIKIMTVTSGNIDKANDSLTKGEAMVEYYHPNCGHCQTLKPEWEKMCFEMKKNYRGKATIAAVDCSDQEMLNKLQIDKDFQGFPTIFHMRDGKSVQEYQGDRTKDALVRFAENSLPITLQEEPLKPALPFVFSPSRSVVLRKYGKGTRGKAKRRSVKKRTSRKKSVQKKAKSIGKNIRKKITRKLRRGKPKK